MKTSFIFLTTGSNEDQNARKCLKPSICHISLNNVDKTATVFILNVESVSTVANVSIWESVF